MASANNPVGWFEIYVADMARTQAFYSAVFQHPMEPLPAPTGDDLQMVAFTMNPEAPGAAGALVKTAMKPPGDGGTLVYFSCTDCATEAALAQANGGQVLQAKMSIGPYGFIAMVKDTEGNTIGLHSMA